MSMDETGTTAVTPLLVLGDADAAACADGFCAAPAMPAGPDTSTAQTGAGE